RRRGRGGRPHAAPADARRRVPHPHRPRRRGGRRGVRAGGGALMAALNDALLLAGRNLRRIPRNPDLLVGVTFQPIMFVVLFTYVFGGAISTPGFDYIDFFLPGIMVQMIAFTGYATALGISDDLRK